MKRLATIGCSAVLALGVVSGCGSDEGSGGDSDSDASGGSTGGDYCSQVEEMKGDFDSVSAPDATIDDMSSAVDRMGEIAGSAPDDVSSEWESMHSALSDMVTAFEDSGLPTDEPLQEAMQADKEKAKKLSESMPDMTAVDSDAAAIEKNVKDECDIELGSGTEQ